MKEHLCNPPSLLLYLFSQFQELVPLFSFLNTENSSHTSYWLTQGHHCFLQECCGFRQGTLPYWSEIIGFYCIGMNKLVIWLWSFCLGHDKESFFFFFFFSSELYVNLLEEMCLQRFVLLVYIGSNTKEDRSCQLDEKMTKWDWSKRWRQIMKWWKEKQSVFFFFNF